MKKFAAQIPDGLNLRAFLKSLTLPAPPQILIGILVCFFAI